MKKKKLVIIMAILIILCATTAVLLIINRGRKYIFPAELIVGENCDDWSDEDFDKYEKLMLKSWEEDYCQEVYINDDRNVVVKFTEKQRKEAVAGLKDIFNDDMMNIINGMMGYRVVSMSNDFKIINLSFNCEYSEEVFDKVNQIPTMLLIQIFEGADPESATVTVNAEFIDTDEKNQKNTMSLIYMSRFRWEIPDKMSKKNSTKKVKKWVL
ncbi:MAG: hypothetical protein IJ763_06515 [Lachnospiraceae bacterium]|nr:hypothetical protein [Lachnospiraceae bacterium]